MYSLDRVRLVTTCTEQHKVESYLEKKFNSLSQVRKRRFNSKSQVKKRFNSLSRTEKKDQFESCKKDIQFFESYFQKECTIL